jgi:hypothetical protein
MKVLHIQGTEFEEVEPKNEHYEFLDGDVYVIDKGLEIYIWIGKNCSVDERGVGAWVARTIDVERRGGEAKVYSIDQGYEPKKFRENIEFDVVHGDTPGFLVPAKLDTVRYTLTRFYVKKQTTKIDEVKSKQVKISKRSINDNDVFVLDMNENVYMYAGKNAAREERFDGQKFMQQLRQERAYGANTYTVNQGDIGKGEEEFFKMLNIASKTKGEVISVEDYREASLNAARYHIPDNVKIEVYGPKGFMKWIKKLFRR